MSLKTVTFEADEQSLATLEETASIMEVDRAQVLREAIALYLDNHESLKAELAEADRQFEGGQTIGHEEMLARYEAMKAAAKERQAA